MLGFGEKMLEFRDSIGRKMSQWSDVFLGLDFRKAEYMRKKRGQTGRRVHSLHFQMGRPFLPWIPLFNQQEFTKCPTNHQCICK